MLEFIPAEIKRWTVFLNARACSELFTVETSTNSPCNNLQLLEQS